MQALGRFIIGENNFVARTPWGSWSALFMSIGFILFQVLMIIIVGLILVFTMVGGQVFAGGIATQAMTALIDPMIIAFFLSYVLTLGFIAFVAGRYGGTVSEVLLFKYPRSSVANGIFGVVALATFFAGLSYVIETFFAQDAVQSEAQMKEIFAALKNSAFLWFGVGVIVVGAPILEEMVFRGFLLNALAKGRLGFWGASVVTSALWALIHGYAVSMAVGLFIFGLLLSLMVRRTGSIWHSIGLHALWNGVVTLATFALLGS